MSNIKTVIITGATRGLGAAMSERLASEYKVIGIGRNRTDHILALEQKFPETFFFVSFDLMQITELRGLVKQIVKQFGPIYGLVNNAALGHDGILSTMHEKQISELIRLNVESPIVLTKYVSRSMLLNGAGRIINVGSIIGSTGFNGLSVYGATKSAMSGFSRSLSRELGKAKITVNTLAPGYMETDMTNSLEQQQLASIIRRSPLGELATVEDNAEMVAYLLSSCAAKITGATFTVDAGSTA